MFKIFGFDHLITELCLVAFVLAGRECVCGNYSGARYSLEIQWLANCDGAHSTNVWESHFLTV
jgi:hypothetical protein